MSVLWCEHCDPGRHLGGNTIVGPCSRCGAITDVVVKGSAVAQPYAGPYGFVGPCGKHFWTGTTSRGRGSVAIGNGTGGVPEKQNRRGEVPEEARCQGVARLKEIRPYEEPPARASLAGRRWELSEVDLDDLLSIVDRTEELLLTTRELGGG